MLLVKSKKTFLKKSFSILLTIVSAILLYKLVDLEQTYLIIKKSDINFMIYALFFYLSGYTFRALRLQHIYHSERLKILKLWPVVAVHNLLNILLPARIGDLTIIFLLKKHFDIKINHGVGLWFIVRMIDVLIVILALNIAIFICYINKYLSNINGIINAMFIANIIFVTFLLFIFLLGVFFRNKVDAILLSSSISKVPLINKIYIMFMEVKQIIGANFKQKQLLILFVISALIWISQFGFFWSVLNASRMSQLNPFVVIIGSLGAIIVQFLPVNSFAGIGTLEAGWVGGFMLVGLTYSNALNSAIFFHVWLLIISTGLVAITQTPLFLLKHFRSGKLEAINFP